MKAAVVGCGHLGGIHARKLAARTDVDLAYVIDPSEANRGRVAEETGATALAGLDQLSERVDVAVVATPTSTHADVAAQLLERGSHLLIEKPIAPTAAEADALCRLATANRCVLQVGHVERFNPAYAAVRSQLDDPKYVETRRTSGFSFRSVDIGAVFDLMIHDIDIVLDLVDSEVASVSAFGCAMLGKREDVAQARLIFGNGCVADLYVSRVSMERSRCMQLLGPEFRATVDFASQTAEISKPRPALVNREFDAEHFAPEERKQLGPNHFETLFDRVTLEPEPYDAIEAEQAAFISAVAGSDQRGVTGHAAARSVQVAEAILSSIEHHQWDGHAAGRIGPEFTELPKIIRPEWPQPVPAQQRRMAG